MLDYTKRLAGAREQRSQHVRSTNNQGFGKKQPALYQERKAEIKAF